MKNNSKPKNKLLYRLILSITTIILIIAIVIGTTLAVKARNVKKYYINEQIKMSKQLPTDLSKQVINKKVDNENKQNDLTKVTNQNLSNLLKDRKQAIDKKIDKTNIGYVKVPSVGISLPVYDWTDQYTLSLGATKYFENNQMGKGNYVLSGHNMDISNVLFSNLPKTNQGDLIYLVNSKHVYKYKVFNKETVSPDQPLENGMPAKDSALYQTPNQPIITLFCCNADGTKRIVVQGKLI